MQLNNKSQAGNVFVIILGGVFLFGALMFTFSRSGSKGTGNLTKQQAKVAAQEILNYARLVEGAVDRVRRNGCSENEINFENGISVITYINANSPIDKSCHIFEPEGGKLEYIKPQEKWLDPAFNIPPWNTGNFGYWNIGNNLPIEGIGSPESELRFTLNFINDGVCTAINDLVNVTNPSGAPPVDGNDSVTPAAQGSFQPPTANIIGDDGGHNLSGKTSFCRTGNSGVEQFNQVLLAR